MCILLGAVPDIYAVCVLTLLKMSRGWVGGEMQLTREIDATNLVGFCVETEGLVGE